MAQTPADPHPLTPAILHILLALADEERHGYGVMQEVARLTAGRIRMGPGTLYGTVKRLLVAGLIAESEERPVADLDDERRRYYRITGRGREVLAAELQRLASLVQVGRTKRALPGTRRA